MNSLSFSMPNMRCGGIVRFLISPLHAPCNPMSMPFALFPRYQPFFTTSVLGLVVKWTNSFIFEKEFEYLKTHADILKRKIEKKYKCLPWQWIWNNEKFSKMNVIFWTVKSQKLLFFSIIYLDNRVYKMPCDSELCFMNTYMYEVVKTVPSARVIFSTPM